MAIKKIFVGWKIVGSYEHTLFIVFVNIQCVIRFSYTTDRCNFVITVKLFTFLSIWRRHASYLYYHDIIKDSNTN